MSETTGDSEPGLLGRRAVITGATGGLGLETARVLAARGAEVVLTGRSLPKGEAALGQIIAESPDARVTFESLDVASLASIREFAHRFAERFGSLDILINNAGVMAPEKRQATIDGFELQLGTNYLGHFALTALLISALRSGRSPRVVQLSSLVHWLGKIQFNDLQSVRSYRPWPAYAQSKLAMLVFALELQRRSDQNGWGLASIACHPGLARTALIANGPGEESGLMRASSWAFPLISQSAAQGALPTLYAASDPSAQAGAYYGPDGLFELKGRVAPAWIAPKARDTATATRLWEVSETLTAVDWPAATDG